MNITSVVVGSTGDVEPFIVLGKELQRRGHRYSVATFPQYRKTVEQAGLTYKLIEGEIGTMMRILLMKREGDSKKSGGNGLTRVLKAHPNLYKNMKAAMEGTDLVIYMQFGALAYHFAEKMNIPAVRTFVFPSDPTKQYSVLGIPRPRNSIGSWMNYVIGSYVMNTSTMDVARQWRKELGLSGWGRFSSYKKMRGRRLTTLYQYSDVLAPRDPKWKRHIHLTGPWMEEEEPYAPSEELQRFLEDGEAPLYIGFGSMMYDKMDELQKSIMDALEKTGQRAILNSSWAKFRRTDDPNIFYSDYIPFGWLFPRVKAVVHHGGCGTTHLGIKAGKPTLVMSFGADQNFWGSQIHYLGFGPEHINVFAGEATTDRLVERFRELEDPKYRRNAEAASARLKRDGGVQEAADIIERL
uniref:Glycosyl transferase, UDP-glucuronosyltransferase n=1 Tax=Eubacterium cellulosolvens (strain ATCC 43171 / JCM 9499 / 6) TaxID=633697 RepID=I5AWZ5_EUBC6